MHRYLVILSLLLCGPAMAAEVGISGLQTIRESTVRELLASRLEFIKARPATASRGNDAAFYLEGVLKRRGYDEPTVRSEVKSPELIMLYVAEGPRSTLGKVHVRGVDAEQGHQLGKLFELAHRGKVRHLGKRVPFLREKSTEGVANATALMDAEGYWAARVSLVSVDRNPATGVTDVTLEVVPGPLHRLAVPRISGGGVEEGTITERLSGLVGEVADTKNIDRARVRVERIFRGAGYHEAQVEMFARHKDGITRLEFTIVPGRRYRVGSFRLTGEKATKPHRILDRFQGVEGSVYDAEDVNDRLKKVYATGAFSDLRLEESPRLDGTIDLTLHATEGTSKGWYFWGGGGGYEGIILGAGHNNRNVFGNLWSSIAGVEVTGLGFRGFAHLTDPFFLERDLRLTGRSSLVSRSFDGWEKLEAGLGADVEWDVTEHYSLKFHLGTAYTEIQSDGIPAAELGPENYLLTSLGLTQIYDRRNDPVVPTSGYYARLVTDVGLVNGDGSLGYFRAHGGLSGYLAITPRATLAATAQAGIIIPNGDPLELPIDMRFFTGGSSTVRSFPERQMGPVASNGDPLGGQAYWAANLEYTHRIAGPLRGLVFLDAGALSPSHDDWGAGELEVAAGLGVWLDLPVGPLRLEYGHSLTRDPGESSGAFHFAVRTTF